MGRNWRAKYLTLERWNEFLKNDFRHLSWKVNGIIAILVIIIGFLVAIFSVAIAKLF